MINDNTPAHKSSGTIRFYSTKSLDRTDAALDAMKVARGWLSTLLENHLAGEAPLVWNQDDASTTALCFAGVAAGATGLMADVIAPYLYSGVSVPGVTIDFKLTEPTGDENVAVQSFGTAADNGTYKELEVEVLNRTWDEIAEIEKSNRTL
jgi:hypothetical protein